MPDNAVTVTALRRAEAACQVAAAVESTDGWVMANTYATLASISPTRLVDLPEWMLRILREDGAVDV